MVKILPQMDPSNISLPFFESVDSWTDEERHTAMSRIEKGFLQAERGELIDGDQARREIQAAKDDWRLGRSPAR
jgi:hypothetical protein